MKKNKLQDILNLIENKVTGAVYFGAAFLILIIGIRGLGKIAGQISMIPKFLLGNDNKLHPNVVLTALILEFLLLSTMAFVTYFRKPENGASSHKGNGQKYVDLKDVNDDFNIMDEMTKKQLEQVDKYLKEYEAISNKISKIQNEMALHISSLKKISQN